MRPLFSARAIARVLVAAVTAALLLPAVVSTPAQAVASNCDVNYAEIVFSDANHTNITGNGTAAGDLVWFKNAVTTDCGSLDAFVTTAAVSGATIDTYDAGNNGTCSMGGAVPSTYLMLCLSANAGGYADVSFSFYLSSDVALNGSVTGKTPVTLKNVNVTGSDIDSSQFNYFTSANGYSVSAGVGYTTNLTVTTDGVAGHTVSSFPSNIYAQGGSTNNNNDPRDQVLVTYANVASGFTVRVGSNKSGTNPSLFGLAFKALSWDPASYTSFGVTPVSYTVTTNTTGTGSGTITPGDLRVDSGTVVTETATADAGSTFTGWSGCKTSANPVISFTVTQNTTCTANFDTGAAPSTYTVTYDGNGSTGGSAPTDGSSPYVADDTVTVLGNTGPLTRTGYHFTGWNTAANGSGTSYSAAGTFNIVANTTLYAQWALDQIVVTYSPGTGTGTLSGGDTVTVNYGDTHTVKASTGYSKAGYHFTGWLSGTSFAIGDSVTITAPKTFTAQWAPNSYTLTTNTNGNGGVTSGGSYNYGDTRTLTATPAAGWHFLGWSGDCDGSSNPLVVTITSNMTCTANFGANPIVTYKLTVSTVGDGTATPGTNWYNDGSKAVVTAKPAAGWIFTGWTGACSGTALVCEVSMTMDKAVTATFVAGVTITTHTPGGGSVNSSQPTGTPLLPGTKVILTATPDDGWEFTGWSGSCSGTENPLTVTLDLSKDCTANFKEKPKPVVEPDLKVKDDTYKTGPNTPLKLPAGASILKNDGSTISKVALATKTKHGTISLGSNGKLVYTPNKGFVGVDSFKYKAFDANGRSMIATVKIVVAPRMPTDIKTGR